MEKFRRKLIKFIAILLTLTAVTYVTTYYAELKNFLFRDNVYVVFDVEKNKYLGLDTISEVSLHYPMKIFNPEGPMSNFRINREGPMSNFRIATSNEAGIFFSTKRRKHIKLSKVNSLNIVSLDSLMKIIRIKRNKSNRKFDHVSLNIIELHSDRAFRMKAWTGSYIWCFIEPEY